MKTPRVCVCNQYFDIYMSVYVKLCVKVCILQALHMLTLCMSLSDLMKLKLKYKNAHAHLT